MIEVDITKLDDIISYYEDLIKQIETNNHNIVFAFKKLSENWNDVSSKKMLTSFNKEMKKNYNLEENLKKQLSVYRTIYNRYQLLGDKIYCNMQKRKEMNDKFKSIISDIKEIIRKINSSDNSNLLKQKSRLESVLNKLLVSKKMINDKLDMIQKNEDVISEKESDLDIEDFMINNYENEV